MAVKKSIIPVIQIEQSILVVRGQKVMLDSALAELYGVDVKRLNEQVRRNSERFPRDFMFQLTEQEWTILRSQIATSSSGHGGRRHLPFVFTEHGAIMLASVLNSDRAIEASIYVVRAFVRLRELLIANKIVSQKLAELERKVVGHDQDIRALVEAIRQLMTPAVVKKRRIGFESK